MFLKCIINIRENEITSKDKEVFIYESLNDIQYNILKYWFYNHNNNKNRYNIELAIDCIEYLKNRDFFDMNHFDKVLLMIIYNELKKIHN